MVTLELSDNEARMLKRLLKKAGDEFSRHGCNDFDVAKELQETKEGGRIFGKWLLERMIESGSAEAEQLETQDTGWLVDWQIFRHFEKLLGKALEP